MHAAINILRAGQRRSSVDAPVTGWTPFAKNKSGRLVAAANQIRPAFSSALDMHGFAQEFEHCGSEIDVAHGRGTMPCRLAGNTHSVRNGGRLLEHQLFSHESMRAHHVAVIAGQNDNCPIA